MSKDLEGKPIDTALLRSEAFRLLLDTLPHIAFVISPGGRAEYYNQRFVDYLGFRPGPNKEARTVLHHPEDQARLEAARDEGAAAVRDYIVEARMRRHDGVYRWHRIHNKPFTRDSKPIAWLGTAVDIHDVVEANEALEQRVRERTAELERANATLAAEIRLRQSTEAELRDSEARHRMLYNRTPVALHSVDADGRLIDLNDTWTETFEYEREAALGRRIAEFMTPESVEKYWAHSWPAMRASQGKVLTEDYQFVTRSGRVFDGRLAARGEYDADGRFVRSWSALSDITAEKSAARELQQALRVETMGQLTAGIAHDFNNLLTAILGNLELLARPSDEAERFERLLEGARSAAERGARLTAQLLAFSRQQRIAARPVDLKALIEGMLPLLRSTIGATIHIAVETAAERCEVLADPTQLELAVVNLAINARDAMAAGGDIRISVAPVRRGEPERPEEPAEGEYLEVAVADTGSGIPDEVRERIFDPFFTTKDVGKGSGLGLSQVLGVSRQLGGGIEVRSRPGEGTRVAIYLPPADHLSAVASDAPARAETTAVDPERSGTILVVDDDSEVRAITADMLRDLGYSVAEAESGEAAIAWLETDGETALLLTDVAMPGMSGVELAERARRMRPSLPILFMTGYAGARLPAANNEHDVLMKPFREGELIEKVTRAIGSGERVSG